MTWTYNTTDRSTPRTEIRELIGDTLETEQLVSDEAIIAALVGRSTLAAAAYCARLARAALMRLPDRSTNGVNVTRARLDALTTIVEDLDARSGTGAPLATPTLTDYSASDAAAELADPDRAPAIVWLLERVR